MYIQGLPAFEPNWADLVKIGQRLKVQVLNVDPSGKALILLDGKETQAILETNAKEGDRFVARVRSTGQEGVVLVRENAISGNDNLTPQDIKLLNERGLPLNGKMLDMVKQFNTLNNQYTQFLMGKNLPPHLAALISTFMPKIPQWSKMSKNGSETLLKLFKALGLDFENRVANMSNHETNDEKAQIQETLKGQILQLVQSKNEKNSKPVLNLLEQLLNYITCQQMWLQSGTKDSAYLLWQIPLNYNQQIYEARVAIESARKGSKLDVNHCHIGIFINTEYLGDLGVDAWFYEQTLSLKILTRYPEMVNDLISNADLIEHDSFHKIGFRLGEVKVISFDEDTTSFSDFIVGKRKSGVDYRT